MLTSRRTKSLLPKLSFFSVYIILISKQRLHTPAVMRRSTRRALMPVILFFTVLFLVIFLNRPQSNKSFAWNKIRYKPSSATLPESRGICPGLATSLKPALVVSRVAADGDPKWLDALAKKYHLCVYTVDAPVNKNSKDLQVPANKGHEAMSYLTFMIDNYDHVPSAGAVFVHGARFQWHNDHAEYDNVALLSALDIPSALKQHGYHNLRCDWSLSTCPLSTPPQGSLETSFNAALAPWDDRAKSDSGLPKTLALLFGEDGKHGEVLLGTTHAVRSQCCAQFVVARDRILQHSREEYVALRQWLLEQSNSDLVAGRMLSYVWHILFVRKDSEVNAPYGIDLELLNQRACPSAEDCYCRLYGRCNLEKCFGGSCFGQYKLPYELKVPVDGPHA